MLWKGCSRVVSLFLGGFLKGFRVEFGLYMEKVWRFLRWVFSLGFMDVCFVRLLGSGGVGIGFDGCRICKFFVCSLWI